MVNSIKKIYIQRRELDFISVASSITSERSAVRFELYSYCTLITSLLRLELLESGFAHFKTHHRSTFGFSIRRTKIML